MKNNNKGKLHRTMIIEWITILTAVLTCFGVLYAEIKGLDGKIERQGDRTDKMCEMHNARSDRLYEMFIDLLKETKCSKDVNTKS
jgi:hypothetical protein